MSQTEYTYLDYAAATPLDPAVYQEMRPFLTDRFGNPASQHSLGRQQQQAVEAARQTVSSTLGAKPAEIVFTSGTTESLNLAIQGVARQHTSQNVVVSAVEHRAVRQVVEALPGVEARVAPVGSDGAVRIDELAALIDDATTLVCVQYANNELGTIQPVTAIGELVAAIRQERRQAGNQQPLYLVCDAAQAGLLNLQVERLGVDLLAMGGGKLYGPAGTGFLYVRTGVHLEPILYGGGQQSGRRSGTENVAGAVGLAAAIKRVQQDRKSEHHRLVQLRRLLVERLGSVEGVRVRTASSQHPGIISITVEGLYGEDMVAHLDAAGFAVATGAACAAGSEEPSTVLIACGLTEAQANSSLRASLGRGTSAQAIERFGAVFADMVDRLRQLSAGA